METQDVAPASAPPITPDTLMRVYAKMRDKLEALQKDTAEIETSMKAVKLALLEHCKANGVDSVRTAYGLAYKTVRTIYSTSDWESFHKFVLENNAPHLLEKRLHQGNMKDFIADNPEHIPPGLNASNEYVITIKRK